MSDDDALKIQQHAEWEAADLALRNREADEAEVFLTFNQMNLRHALERLEHRINQRLQSIEDRLTALEKHP